MKRLRAAIWIVPLSVLALAGCGEDFDPYNRLNSLRVLAIASDPASPGSSETATLTPLIYATEDHPPLSFAWSWCPVAAPIPDGGECAVDEAEFNRLAMQGGVSLPPYDLGSEPTAQFTNAFDPALLAQLCAQSVEGLGLLNCEHGFPIQIRFTVTTAKDELVTVRTLRLRFGEIEANHNPAIAAIRAILPEEGELELAEPSEGVEPEVTLPRRASTTIMADISESEAESYQSQADPDAQADSGEDSGQTRERLLVTWFVETGSTKYEHTSFDEGVQPIEETVENRWEPERVSDYPSSIARLWVVVRDDRGGVGWRSAAVQLSETP
jgi:hypothetical protein